MAEICIKEWLKAFKEGEFDSKSRFVQIEAGWYDWFCSDTALAAKTKMLGGKLATIVGSPKFDIEKTYVWFKNNCPMVGPLYDDFRIADIETGDTMYTIQHLNKGSHRCEHAHWEVWGRENNFKEPLVDGDWKAVKEFFLVK